MPAMLIYSIFMLVESTIMLNTMLIVVAKITTTTKNNPGWHQWLLLIWALTEPSSDVELAGSAWRLSVTLLLEALLFL